MSWKICVSLFCAVRRICCSRVACSSEAWTSWACIFSTSAACSSRRLAIRRSCAKSIALTSSSRIVAFVVTASRWPLRSRTSSTCVRSSDSSAVGWENYRLGLAASFPQAHLSYTWGTKRHSLATCTSFVRNIDSTFWLRDSITASCPLSAARTASSISGCRAWSWSTSWLR